LTRGTAYYKKDIIIYLSTAASKTKELLTDAYYHNQLDLVGNSDIDKDLQIL